MSTIAAKHEKNRSGLFKKLNLYVGRDQWYEIKEKEIPFKM